MHGIFAPRIDEDEEVCCENLERIDSKASDVW